MSDITVNKTGKPELYTVLYTSENQGKDEESTSVIRDSEALSVLYESVGIENVPEIDFKKNQVVALFLGTKRTGGYGITVERVEEVNNQISIHKKITTPQGDMVTTALTNPFVIVEIHSTKEIIIK
ncbi:protease complex subunit PrcB family protein [Flavobacterium tegetincola]|uniref:protease complex subunit PrcB family protein n=1 Tax=Flavobacterium tegetincola TaxID=150172 RepID=UPI000400A6C5|nr:protease complex subunit PrcB family protein [Flavobacterium tegetincola]